MAKDHLLTSIVFKLESDDESVASQAHRGRTAYSVCLAMLNTLTELEKNSTYELLANDLHLRDEMLPLTVSDLFSQQDGSYLLRLTGISDTMVIILETLSEHVPFTTQVETSAGQVYTWQVQDVVDHAWSQTTRVSELIRHAQTNALPHKLQFNVVTPTAIRSKGLMRAFPEPALMFNSLYRRWQHFNDIVLSFTPNLEDLVEFCERYVSVKSFSGSTHIRYKGRSIAAYQGKITYQLHRKNKSYQKFANHIGGDFQARSHYLQKHNAEFTRLVHLLAEFACYSGVGVQVAQGMGMIYLMY